ncbi:MAG: universal stress protein [Halanaeroarchaeum sp.]
MKKILVPLDGSEQSWTAFEYALEEFPSATVVLLHVIDPVEAGYSTTATVPGYTEQWYEQSQDRADQLFEEAAERADDTDLERETEVGRPSRIIVEYTAENDVDQIVMGSHGRSGVTRILLGSVAETVVRRSPVPVTIVR